MKEMEELSFTPRYGKYRATVGNTNDPRRMGRIEVRVPEWGEEWIWAMPCVPYAGQQKGLVLTPDRGSSVWVEYEGGNPSLPIVCGAFWNNAEEYPSETFSTSKRRGLKLEDITLSISESVDANAIELTVDGKLAGNSKITIACGKNGITISQGGKSVVITSSSVDINEGGLKVT